MDGREGGRRGEGGGAPGGGWRRGGGGRGGRGQGEEGVGGEGEEGLGGEGAAAAGDVCVGGVAARRSEDRLRFFVHGIQRSPAPELSGNPKLTSDAYKLGETLP